MAIPARKILHELGVHKGWLHQDGTVNRSKFGQKTGIPAPTISRILASDDSWRMNRDTCKALINYFGITFAEACGDVPITSIYPKERGSEITPTPTELELIRMYRDLDQPQKGEILEFVRFKKQTAKPSESNGTEAAESSRDESQLAIIL